MQGVSQTDGWLVGMFQGTHTWMGYEQICVMSPSNMPSNVLLLVHEVQQKNFYWFLN